ncbi:MAG: RidA family protein [Ardenticatenaceae bacterium]|nr:RidA family protein [Ardenticatenaceae bacterium]
MTQRQTYKTGAKWEDMVGYSRAVRIRDMVFVSGTTATDEQSNIVGVGDAYLQTKQIFKNIARGLQGVGASWKDVVRTRMFVVDIAKNWEAVGRAHGEIFAEIQPAATMVEVSGLISPDMLVEIEVEAVISQE